jgi:hypothetical protein
MPSSACNRPSPSMDSYARCCALRHCLVATFTVTFVSTGLGATPNAERSGETIEQALCRLVEGASQARGVPVPFLTRLIWQESSFRTDVISRAGAQGVAQFMPGTARERGLANPFDPEQAIPAAAALLSDLRSQFGNLGLAAAAYNAGPGRVSAWLQGSGGLPGETRDYVFRITGRSAEDWAVARKTAIPEQASDPAPQSCLQVTAAFRLPGRANVLVEAALAPWGVQLAGNFSKELALASYARARQSYAAVIGDVQPMIIGTRLRSRGSRPFYRVRVPAQTRAAANALCDRIRAAKGSCVTLRS